MDAFDCSFKNTLGLEGEYSDVPEDRGGRTKFGVTEKTFLHALDRGIISGTADIRDLTVAQAKAIYKTLVWLPLRLHEIADWCIVGEIFDTAVNMGPGRAALIAQLALKYLGETLTVDGILGSETIGLVNKWCAKDPRALMVALNGFQFIQYVDLADEELVREILKRVKSDSTQFKFTRGWTKRIQEYRKVAAG